MNRSALPAALMAVCCALLAGTVLRAYHVPLMTRAAAQAEMSAPPVPFDPFARPRLRPAHPQERSSAVASIAAQLAAFNANDYKKAAQFQSMGLRQNFPSITAFKHMIETAYPQFAHSRKVQYGPAQAERGGSHVLVPVTLTGQDGVTLSATYVMVREGVPSKPVYRVEGVLGGAHRLPPPIAPGTGRDA